MLFIVRMLFILLISLVNSQYVPQTPCPGTFDYIENGDQTYGKLTFHLKRPSTTVNTRVNFTIAAPLPSRYVGRLEPFGNEIDILRDLNQGRSMSYRVFFPITSPLPRLTGLAVNDDIICYGAGDELGPGKYVTTIGLQHSLFLKSGTLPINHDYFANPSPDNFNMPVYDRYDIPNQTPERPVYDKNSEDIGDYSIYTNVDTIENQRPYTNRDPQWSDVFYLINRTRPFQQQPVTPHLFQNVPVTPAPTLPIREQSYRPPVENSRPYVDECGVVYGGNEKVSLIVKGQSYERGDWPWLTAIYKRKEGSLSFICSGTLVSNRHIISAAHCMQQKSSRTSMKDIVIRVGIYDLEDWGDDITLTRTLESATIHDAYNAKTLMNDIIIFTMERRVEFSNHIRPACLWTGNPDLNRIVGATGVVTGWGKTEFTQGGHGEPRMVRMPIVSTATCLASRLDFHKLTSANTLCAGDRNGAGPCLGDSGGGLYILDGGRWKVRGVVSLSLRPENGDNTCNLNEYIVFTDTAKYMSWITDIIRT